MMVQKWGLYSPRGQKERQDAWPAYFDLMKVLVERKRLPAAQPPLCGQKVHKQPGRTARLSRRIKMSALKSTWEKMEPTIQSKTEVQGGWSGLSIYLYIANCWQMKGYPTFTFICLFFLWEQWPSAIAVHENHQGSFFCKQLYWCAINCIYFKCTIWYVLIYVHTHKTISTIKFMNIPITPKHLLMPFVNPPSCSCPHHPSSGGLLKTTDALDHTYRDSDQLAQGKGQESGFFKAPRVVLMCNQGWELLYYTILLISA